VKKKDKKEEEQTEGLRQCRPAILSGVLEIVKFSRRIKK
jgi:hypothetical protein